MMRTGIGIDAHRFAVGRSLILGGVHIKHAMGLDGHSDADVLCHAIADALLGSVARGDIGRHFPNTDPTWKDASSIDLLSRTIDIVTSTGAAVNNVDATVMAEEPKLAPYIDAMRANIAEALDIEAGRVSVKATTVEGMGSLGRKEGIAAMAIAAVELPH